MAVEANEAIPVLERRAIAADEEDGTWQRSSQVWTALGGDGGDVASGTVPAIFPDAPAISSCGVDPDLAVVGEDRGGQRRAFAGGEEELEGLVQELNVNVLFWLDMEFFGEQVVQDGSVALMQDSDG